MAYRFEKEQGGQEAMVIDGWEKGIADSPYDGIANMRNLNTYYYPGMAYSNYKRIRVNSAGGNRTFTASTSPSKLTLTSALTLNVGDAVTLTTTTTLPSPLVTSTTYFVQAVSGLDFQLSTTLGGGAIVILSTGTGTHTLTLTTMGAPSFYTQNNSSGTNPYGTIYILDKNGRVWQNTATVNSLPYFVLLFGNTIDGSIAQGIAFYANYLFVFRGSSIDICGDGTGAVNSALWTNGWFSNTPITLTATANQGDTSATLLVPTVWGGPTGTYNLTFINESVIAHFTNDSDQITWEPPLLVNESDVANVNLGNSGITHMALVCVTNDTLYFCNGRYIGAITTPAGRIFDKQLVVPGTSDLNYAALFLPIGIWSSWLEIQQLNLLVAAQDTIYPWDRTSLVTGIPMPITENIYRMINISNTVYVLAGLKGNIYTTNGYSISVLRKIPDNIATGLIDPEWSWGGLIAHRQTLYFSAFAQNGQTGTSILNGILSISDKGVINFENQNSNGLTNASATGDAVLVDVNTTARDSYYSSWYDGTTGGIDYNNTTLYSNFEPLTETDLIPVGTFLINKSFLNIEFKLDQPMVAGDSIRVSCRQSESDSYTLLGTTTTTVLSDVYTPFPLQSFQWIQFKIEFKSGGIGQYVRLREMRVR